MEHTRFIGLDVHKERISVAVAESGRSGAVDYIGEIDNDPGAIGKLCQRLGRAGKPLAFCYEAGPCGYGVHRHLISAGSCTRRPTPSCGSGLSYCRSVEGFTTPLATPSPTEGAPAAFSTPLLSPFETEGDPLCFAEPLATPFPTEGGATTTAFFWPSPEVCAKAVPAANMPIATITTALDGLVIRAYPPAPS